MHTPDRTKATVLIVEDDDAMRELLIEEVGDAGFQTVSAPDGRVALERLKTEAVDVVITDLRMPEVDGFDLIRDIKANAASPHIIMITAFGSIETAIKAVKLGAYDYITKPFEIEELILVADKALGERSLQRQVARLQAEVEQQYQFDNVVCRSEGMLEVLSLVKRISGSMVSTLITGESGTGKELIARAIHYNSPRANMPFVAVNLAAIPDSLIEAELFGYKRGAFTDARTDHPGLFVEADGGSLFLDEIGELASGLQAKLLRALQEHEVRPLGASETVSVDVRLISATNRDLQEMMSDGRFREDLYYRLNVVQLDIPPLRHRPDDIVPLIAHVLQRAKKKSKSNIAYEVSAEAQRILLSYSWPGNVRELENILERGVALCQGAVLGVEDLPPQLLQQKPSDLLAGALRREMRLADLEREYILLVLEDEGGNKTRAASRLGLDRKTLYRKLEEYSRTSKD